MNFDRNDLKGRTLGIGHGAVVLPCVGRLDPRDLDGVTRVAVMDSAGGKGVRTVPVGGPGPSHATHREAREEALESQFLTLEDYDLRAAAENWAGLRVEDAPCVLLDVEPGICTALGRVDGGVVRVTLVDLSVPVVALLDVHEVQSACR